MKLPAENSSNKLGEHHRNRKISVMKNFSHDSLDNEILSQTDEKKVVLCSRYQEICLTK